MTRLDTSKRKGGKAGSRGWARAEFKLDGAAERTDKRGGAAGARGEDRSSVESMRTE